MSRLTALTAYALCAALCARSNTAIADEPEYSGVFACLGCHSAGDQTPYVDSLPLVRMDEVRVWQERDKHRLAFCVLTGELGRRMSERLGYDVAKADACLACHAPRHELRSADPATPPNYKLAEGVSCEDCHGGSRGWHRLHVLKDQWRVLAPQEKQSHGLRDLGDPLTRAAVCLDCHVGNAEHGQMVTHAMYAAGHPPLASIDIAAYADEMPRHWRTPDEQAARGAQAAGADADAQARMALVGHLVAAERALRLATPQDHSLPDFAHFDCDACHHELASPSWRQARFTSGAPGRPQYREWPLRMAAFAGKQAGADATAEFALTSLREALSAQAFGGDGQRTAEAATSLADHWAAQAKALSSRQSDSSDAERLATNVLAEALDPARPPDYDTARTLAWMLRHARTPRDRSGGEHAWNALADLLGLTIPERNGATSRIGYTPSCAAPVEEPIADALAGALRFRANYDPAMFQDALRKYAEAAGLETRSPDPLAPQE